MREYIFRMVSTGSLQLFFNQMITVNHKRFFLSVFKKTFYLSTTGINNRHEKKEFPLKTVLMASHIPHI